MIGTEATISSHAYARALQAHGIEAAEKACPLLVPLVEEGWSEHAVAEQVARIYLDQAFVGDFESADVLVLGCTHYPLLKPLLHRLVPSHVTIVDSADSTARVVSQSAPPRPAETVFGSRTSRRASPEILCDRFSGKISPPGGAISGKSN